MHDTLLDDVNALLLNEIGDKRILEQIRRAFENNEPISINERNYVAGLRDANIRQKPVIEVPQVSTPSRIEYASVPKPQKRIKISRNIMIIIGAVILVAIVGAGVMFLDIGTGISSPAPPPPQAIELPLYTDTESYNSGDLIAIYGKSDVSLGPTAELSIRNPGNALVWTGDASLNSDGVFSTVVIAAGAGWSDDGTYTVTMQHGANTEQYSFAFAG